MKVKLVFFFLAVGIWVLGVPFELFAEVEYTFLASEDAWVNEVNPAVNYGNSTYLSVKDRSGLSEAYLKFSQQDFSILTGHTIESVSLFLYQYQGTNSPGDMLNLHQLKSDWSESSVAWNSKPDADLAAISHFNITGELNTTGWREWAGLENVVSGWRTGQNFGLSLENNLDNRNEELFARFYSSEYSDPVFRPYLKVTTTPEPISAVLFIIGSAVLGIGLKKH